MSINKPLKAYHVQGEECGVIVFAKSNAAARRVGAAELNSEFESIEYCRRAQWADVYADRGWVPVEKMIEKGWWHECSNCYSRVFSDSEDAEGVPHDPVFDGRDVYCSRSCKDQAESKQGGK